MNDFEYCAYACKVDKVRLLTYGKYTAHSHQSKVRRRAISAQCRANKCQCYQPPAVDIFDSTPRVSDEEQLETSRNVCIYRHDRQNTRSTLVDEVVSIEQPTVRQLRGRRSEGLLE